MNTTTNPCTNCRDNFPLPSGPLDFFDTQVVADYIQRRTACTLRPADAKPCLQPAPAQAAPAQPAPIIAGHTPFDALRKDHGTILTEFETARIAGALQGIAAITTVLTQREIDAEGSPDGLTFSPALAVGLLAALASCAEFAQGVVDSGGLLGARAAFGSPAYDRLIQARNEVTQDAQAREEGGQQ